MALDEQVLAELIALRKAVSEQTTGLAVNTEIVTGLKRTLDDVRGNAVPRGEWVESRRSDQQRFSSIEDAIEGLLEDRKDDASFRRTVMAMLAAAAFSAVFSAVVAFVFALLGKG